MEFFSTLWSFLVIVSSGFGLLTGVVLLIYGMYGMSVEGFNKSVRNFCLGFGIFLIALTLSVFLSFL